MTPLYRYISLNSNVNFERFFKLLNENKLYFSSPKYFNDPYDAKIHFADGSVEEIENYLLFTHKRKYPNDSDEKVLRLIRARPPKYNSSWIRETSIKELDPSFDKLGVVCLSENNNDILMWSHYSDAHRGICLEFDKDIIDSSKWFIGKVDYPEDNHYVDFKVFREAIENNEKAFRTFLLRKSFHWVYEKEWRIIVGLKAMDENSSKNAEDKQFLPCHEKMLTGIILGMKTPDTLKQTFSQLVQNKSIKLYEAKRNENSYVIDVRECECPNP